MKYKKSLLSLAMLGIFASTGLAAAPSASAKTFTDFFDLEDKEGGAYYIDANRINIACGTNTDEYKVSQNYNSDKLTWFRFDDNCTNITFDINGKSVADGAIAIPGGATVTLKDSVGNGTFYNLASRNDAYVDYIVAALGYGASTGSTVKIESGTWQGSFNGNNRNLNVQVVGGTFKDSTWEANSRVSYSIAGGAFSNMALTTNDTYQGQTNISGGKFTNTTFSVRTIGGNDASSIAISGGEFDGYTVNDNSNLLKLTISGGTFSTKPDEKYLVQGLTTYAQNGKFIVDRDFMLTDFFQYMYIGQSSEAYVSPGLVAKTAKVTSSDESVLGVSCKDSKIIPGQMVMETTDGSIGSKVCTITAKKAGRATLSYATDYGYNGNITVYVADVDATDYSSDADSAKYELLARYLSVWNAETVEHSWLSTAPSAFVPEAVEGYKKEYASTAAAIKAGHKIKLNLDFKDAALTEEEQKILEGKNIAAAYTAAGSVFDSTDKKTILEDWHAGISSFPLPEILKNRNRTVQVATFTKYPQSTEGDYSIIDATVKGNRIIVAENYSAHGDAKFVILYDGSPINPDGTTDDVPATPNSAGFGEEHSTLLILGTSIAGLLAISAPAIYLVHRKKSLGKVRF